MRDFKRAVERFDERLKALVTDYMLLSNEGCGRCETCTYPSAPCRFPDRLYHSIEGYGFAVNELAAEAGLRYNNGVNTVTFFGALLFNAVLATYLNVFYTDVLKLTGCISLLYCSGIRRRAAERIYKRQGRCEHEHCKERTQT